MVKELKLVIRILLQQLQVDNPNGYTKKIQVRLHRDCNESIFTDTGDL